MIPKIIHYCWFGDEPIPSHYQEYIDNWKKLNPEYEIMLWNESNSPMSIKYLKNAKKNKKWANMSNFVRFHALYNHGGIYLDTDIKLIKPLDELLKNDCFLGFEQESDDINSLIVNNAVLGAKQKHKFIDQCLKYISTYFNGTENADISAPAMVTTLLKGDYNLTNKGYQVLSSPSSITIYPTDYFYPIHVHRSYQLDNWESHISENTVCIHMWGRSWLTVEEAKKNIDWLNKCLIEKDERLKESSEQYTSLRKNADEVWKVKVHFENLANERNNEIKRLKELVKENTGNFFEEIKNAQGAHQKELIDYVKEILTQELQHLKNENGIYFRRKILKEELDRTQKQLLNVNKELESIKISMEEKISEIRTLEQNNLKLEHKIKQIEDASNIKIHTLEGNKRKNNAENELLKKEIEDKLSNINVLSDKLKKEIEEKQAISSNLSELKNEITEKQNIINDLSNKVDEKNSLIEAYKQQISTMGFVDVIRKKLIR